MTVIAVPPDEAVEYQVVGIKCLFYCRTKRRAEIHYWTPVLYGQQKADKSST
jgi:hypothetical protein